MSISELEDAETNVDGEEEDALQTRHPAAEKRRKRQKSHDEKHDRDVSGVLKNISKPGNVYSMDGKLLMTGATLNSLKTLGKGMYILNGVKVLVK